MATSIAFEDIRVGDKITVTSTKPNGATAVYTDTVTGMRDGGVQTDNFYFDIGANYNYNYTYELVSRPAPAEPQGLGAVVLVTYSSDGSTDTFVRAPDDRPTQPWCWVGGIHGLNHYTWDDVAYRDNTITVLNPGVPA